MLGVGCTFSALGYFALSHRELQFGPNQRGDTALVSPEHSNISAYFLSVPFATCGHVLSPDKVVCRLAEFRKTNSMTNLQVKLAQVCRQSSALSRNVVTETVSPSEVQWRPFQKEGKAYFKEVSHSLEPCPYFRTHIKRSARAVEKFILSVLPKEDEITSRCEWPRKRCTYYREAYNDMRSRTCCYQSFLRCIWFLRDHLKLTSELTSETMSTSN